MNVNKVSIHYDVCFHIIICFIDFMINDFSSLLKARYHIHDM